MTSQEAAVRSRPVDVSATILLLIGHMVLAFVTYLVVGLAVMGTDPCGYVQCGNQEWANVGVLTAMIGGVVLVVVDLVVSIVRMAKGKPAWFVPVIFCVVQVGLGVAGFALVSLAGPV